jgi:hypothetical protein
LISSMVLAMVVSPYSVFNCRFWASCDKTFFFSPQRHQDTKKRIIN